MYQTDEGTIDYLASRFETDDVKTFLGALKKMVQIAPGMTTLANDSGVNREHLYRMLGDEGNPSFQNMLDVVQALGMTFSLISYIPPPKDHTKSIEDKAGFKQKSLFKGKEKFEIE